MLARGRQDATGPWSGQATVAVTVTLTEEFGVGVKERPIRSPLR